MLSVIELQQTANPLDRMDRWILSRLYIQMKEYAVALIRRGQSGPRESYFDQQRWMGSLSRVVMTVRSVQT